MKHKANCVDLRFVVVEMAPERHSAPGGLE